MKWKVEVPRGFKGHRNIVTSDGVKVATVWEDGNNTESTAQLLAAAPELLEALEFGRTAIGEHIAPSDCYVTGPLTGNYIEDLIVCPACRFISAYEKAIAKAKGE